MVRGVISIDPFKKILRRRMIVQWKYVTKHVGKDKARTFTLCPKKWVTYPIQTCTTNQREKIIIRRLLMLKLYDCVSQRTLHTLTSKPYPPKINTDIQTPPKSESETKPPKRHTKWGSKRKYPNCPSNGGHWLSDTDTPGPTSPSSPAYLTKLGIRSYSSLTTTAQLGEAKRRKKSKTPMVTRVC